MDIEGIVKVASTLDPKIAAVTALVSKIIEVGKTLNEGRRARTEINDMIGLAIANAETVDDAIAALDNLYQEAKAYNEAQWNQAVAQNPLLQ